MNNTSIRSGVIIAFFVCFSITKVYGQLYVHQIYEQAQSNLEQYKLDAISEEAPSLNLQGFFAHKVSALINKNSDGSYSYVITLKGTGGHGGYYFPELAEKFKYVELKVNQNSISFYKQESQFVPSDTYTSDDTNDPMLIGHMKVPADPFQYGNTMDIYMLNNLRYEHVISEEEYKTRILNKIHKPGSSSFKSKVIINGKEYMVTVRRNCTHSRVPLYRGTYLPNYNAGVSVSKSRSGRVTRTIDPFPDHWFKHQETLTYSLDELSQLTGMSKQELIIYMIANDVLNLPYRDAFIVCAYKAFGLDKQKEQHRINDSIAREQIWDQIISNEKDYSRVASIAKNKVVGKEHVFTDEFINRILERAQQLKNDSITNLFRSIQNCLENQQFSMASGMAHQLFKIDPKNLEAKEMCYLSDFELIKEREKDGCVKDSEYADYINDFPYSPYTPELMNRRVLHACSNLSKNSSDAEIDFVSSLPCDSETKKLVDKRCYKLKLALHHGPFVQFGVGGDYAFGAANYSFSGGIESRFGYLGQRINLSIGAKYNYIANITDSNNPPNSGYFSKKNISVPVMLRVNCFKDFTTTFYIGMGTEFYVKTLGASFQWTKNKDVEIRDICFSNNSLAVSPRLSIGVLLNKYECEVFGLFDINNPFDINYIDNYLNNADNEIASQFLIDPKVYEKLTSNDSFDRLRLGISIKRVF